eukprot:1993053-Amphidinium_carterae.1
MVIPSKRSDISGRHNYLCVPVPGIKNSSGRSCRSIHSPIIMASLSPFCNPRLNIRLPLHWSTRKTWNLGATHWFWGVCNTDHRVTDRNRIDQKNPVPVQRQPELRLSP